MKSLKTLTNLRKLAQEKLLYIVFGVLIIVIIASKVMHSSKEDGITPAAVRVYATPIKAAFETVTLRTSGISKASRRINLLSETSGQIYKLYHKKGHILNAKDPIATIQLDDRGQQLKEAKASHNLAKEKLDVTKKLAAENFRSELNLKTAQVEYESASVYLAKIEKDIENTRIVAPFKGVLGSVLLEEGSVVAPGMAVATILNLDPILVQIYISEKNYGQFKVGDSAQMNFSNGEALAGKIEFISSIADPKTHMFLVEVTAENPDFKIPEGVTAKVKIPTVQHKVHKINPSVLLIDSNGNMAVKVLNQDKQVESYPIKIVHSVGDVIWVSGLPEETILINYGAHFVNVGDIVQWEPAEKLKGHDNAQ